jgi:hypothetical protein
MIFVFLTAAFLPALSQASQEEVVQLLCKNSENQTMIFELTKSDYDFLKFGNNRLESEFTSISNKKRVAGFNLLDKKDKNLATAVYSCFEKN